MGSRLPDLSLIAAPMVNQSDLPFRILTRAHGATLAYTQMLLPDRLLADQPYRESHQRGLGAPHDRPVVVQLAGNDPDTLVRAARTLLGYCDAVDLNLGCPQDAAREGHYGAYLLPQHDWPLAQNIVSALAHALPVPVSTKLRLCHPAPHTLALAHRLEAAGAAWLTLHARYPSARRRRHAAADLDQVRALKFGPERAGAGDGGGGGVRIPVVSNGNVRTWADVVANKAQTGADGIMVGEALLANPW
ncbi:hypothetical protein HETIRDRAFT_157361 [Heterobasidion irregulare TC 32-1]|uniref:tRNA-dihydrouridine(16/17) synthase [NAD(P)(+)] n=1 Tax=Heterobasidion irregulare (strain TC 32-1) TaxID=747525 RepID=W4JYH0_HETIT|nr:uncharacterized protein HETIRDRAFT_157361 [Heterobasidion irregulare TC 32-1]ETW77906.1 hypothetical protein HETIRDRAFT_157361 [Heterobasidion irregulare TC 32-1]